MSLAGVLGYLVVLILTFCALSSAADEGWTRQHEKGRCAIRGQCGKQGFFGSQLPCPDNGLAKEPNTALREKLVGICGDKWGQGAICCEDEQVRLVHIANDWLLIFGFNSLTLLAQISNAPKLSSLLVRHVRRISSTSSAPLHALQTSRCLSMLRRRRQRVTSSSSPS